MKQYSENMDDNFKIIYKILSAFERSLDVEDFELKSISAEKLGITGVRWTKYIEMLVEAEYLAGIEVQDTITGIDVLEENPHITLKGLEYLAENSIMQRMYKTAKGIKDLIK
ncbi:YjcQ family protein [Treponema sp.]|uniref:YjcQ family protein n=1 Tax=Treponema sp. TaxID=166 RepID=UPI003FD84B14